MGLKHKAGNYVLGRRKKEVLAPNILVGGRRRYERACTSDGLPQKRFGVFWRLWNEQRKAIDKQRNLNRHAEKAN
jgi:hypothetical protein